MSCSHCLVAGHAVHVAPRLLVPAPRLSGAAQRAGPAEEHHEQAPPAPHPRQPAAGRVSSAAASLSPCPGQHGTSGLMPADLFILAPSDPPHPGRRSSRTACLQRQVPAVMVVVVRAWQQRRGWRPHSWQCCSHNHRSTPLNLLMLPAAWTSSRWRQLRPPRSKVQAALRRRRRQAWRACSPPQPSRSASWCSGSNC